MAQKVLEVNQLVGQNRNRVRGQAVGETLTPYRVFNLVPHRAGGYAPFGWRVRLNRDYTNINIFSITRLIGHDETGISSYFETTMAGDPPLGVLQLFRGATLYDQHYQDYANAHMAVHLDNAGAYLTRDQYLVLDREDRPVEPIHVRITPISRVGSPTQGQQVGGGDIGHFSDIEFGDGAFIAVTSAGYIFRSTNKGGNWEEIAFESGANFTSIAYGAGRWVAGTNNGSVYWSDDDGDNWNLVIVQGGWVSDAVSWGGGARFFFAGAAVSGEPGIFRSEDGGLTWSLIFTTTPSAPVSRVARVAYDPIRQLFIAQSRENAWGIHYYSMTGGDNFAYANIPGSHLGIPEWSWIESIGPNAFVATNFLFQRIAQGTFIDGFGAANGVRWSQNITLDESPAKVKFNRVRNQIVAVGGLFNARVWSGPSVGSLSRQTEIEDAFIGILDEQQTVRSVAFDDDGDAVYVGSNGTVVTTGAGTGLRRGTYNMWFVSYFNTKAGRFVFDLQRTSLTFSTNTDNEIDVLAQSQESILEDNPWLGGSDPALAAEIVADIRVDAYIQFVPQGTGIGNEDISTADLLAEHTIRYAFTSAFPEDGEDAQIGRSLDSLPIGKQIVQNGLPTTVVFEPSRLTDEAPLPPVQSRTAVHNGRVWGLAAQDEDRWAIETDLISPEIANQFNRFVLTYTETGWANLISDQSFIPIQPRQSMNFTGIISSPNGLLVMFDNEIWVVNGDPAFGNLVVELYMDLIGNDLGSPPCAVGGVVFTIWGGKIWAIQAGQAQDISTDQWLQEDPFVRVTPEPQTRSILALTSTGLVFRYLVDDQFWLTDPVNRDNEPLLEMLPNCVCLTGDNTRFVQSGGAVWVTREDETPDSPYILYRDVDFGTPGHRSSLYQMKYVVEGNLASTAQAQVLFRTGSTSNGLNVDTINPTFGVGIPARTRSRGSREVAMFSHRMPLGLGKYPSIDLKLQLGAVAYTDVIKLPMQLFYTSGGEIR